MKIVISPSSVARAQLWDEATSDFRHDLIDKARQTLERDLTKRTTAGQGYTVSIEVHTLDRVSAATYRSWSEWFWDSSSHWCSGE